MSFYTVSPVRLGSQGQASRTSSPPPRLQKSAVAKDAVCFGRIPHPDSVDLPSPTDNPNVLREHQVYRLRQSHDPDALQNQIVIGNGPDSTVYSISDDPVRQHPMQTYFLYLDGTHVGEIYRINAHQPWSAYKLFEGDAPIPLIPHRLVR